MVELVATGAGEDTVLVELEAGLVGLDGDGDGLLGHGGLELVFVLGGHILVRGDGDRLLGLLGGLASAGLGGVGVGRLEGVALLLNVPETVVHEAAIAALVTEGLGAVDE